jgi:hypothetical protein
MFPQQPQTTAKKKGPKFNAGQFLNFTHDSYFERTSRPFYAVVFLLPFIVFYEMGTLMINTDVLSRTQVRVVAFVWLQNSLEYLGFGNKLAWAMPPLVVVIILLALQLVSRKRWSFAFADVLPMTVECVLLAVPLIVLSLFLNTPAPSPSQYDAHFLPPSLPAFDCSLTTLQSPSQTTVPDATGADGGTLLAHIVTGVGAGIYEELVFRLILICLLMIVLQDLLRLNRQVSIVLAVIISAALFSAHHHVVLLNGSLTWAAPFNSYEFGFRTVAGVYFAAVFAVRGFGITAVTHAFYDVIATVINFTFFSQ